MRPSFIVNFQCKAFGIARVSHGRNTIEMSPNIYSVRIPAHTMSNVATAKFICISTSASLNNVCSGAVLDVSKTIHHVLSNKYLGISLKYQRGVCSSLVA